MAAPDPAPQLSKDSSCTGGGVHTCPSAWGQPRIQGFGEVLDASRHLQRAPSPPYRGLTDGGATVGPTPDQLALPMVAQWPLVAE